jgi:hypothetical protein
MKNIEAFVLLFLSVILLGCKGGSSLPIVVQYKDGKQIPILDTTESELIVIAPDTVNAGEEYCAKVLLASSNKKLVKSYALCDFSVSLVDTLNKTLDNCDGSQLKIENDTTYFCLQPTSVRAY